MFTHVSPCFDTTALSYMFCCQGAEDDMHTAVGTIGPVSIAYDVAKDFRFYKKGVYSR